MNSFNLALKSFSWFIENSFVALKFLFVIFLVAIPIAWAQANPGWLVGLIAYPLWLIVISAVMIQLHRFILLDLDTNEIRFIEKPKKSTFIYLGYWVLITATERASGMLIEYIPTDNALSILALWFIVALILFILFKAYMVFPATALGKDFNFAWALSRGAEKHLFLSTIILILLMIPLAIVMTFILTLSTTSEFFLFLGAYFITVLFLFIVNVHYSLLFKLFTEKQN